MIADKETRVWAAAVACVADYDFQVPTARIAAHAGVGEATLFRTFATKDLLLAATYPYVLVQLTATLGPRLGEALREVGAQHGLSGYAAGPA